MSRYYEPNPTDQIKPGKLSDELRQALDLPENDVPIWIYRMRALGYPPGWLKKAMVETQDIFDTDDNSSKKRSHDKQEEDETQYDHSKLIEYPGFNTPLPEGCNDYHYYVNMPCMLEHQQLEYAKKHMKCPDPTPKRFKVGQNSTEETDGQTSESPHDEQPPNSESSEEVKPNIKEEKVKLEIKKEDCDTKLSSDGLKKEIVAVIPKAEGEQEHVGEKEGEESAKANVTSDSLPNISIIKQEVKLVSKGSPMPKLSRTPLERFSEGVTTDLLYFENIANSTGRFDNIRGLLNTMRKSL